MSDSNTPLPLPCHVKVVLGECRKTLPEILSVQEGSILELDRLAGEPVSVEVNGKALFRGEVVVIDENFGVRITGLVTPDRGGTP